MLFCLFRSPPHPEDVPVIVEEGESSPTHWCTLYREDGSLEVCVGWEGSASECWEGGGGDGCEGTIISCVLSCVCADLSDPTIQIGVFCEELFICSQNTNG